jgi:hypothetical protein
MAQRMPSSRVAGSMPALAPGECHAGLEQARALGLVSGGKTTCVASETHAATYGSQVAIGAQVRSPRALPPRGATSWGDDKVVSSMGSRGWCRRSVQAALPRMLSITFMSGCDMKSRSSRLLLSITLATRGR